ncbi:MAG TPA: hypothetical protein DD381_11790 [Lentisphaeria bacterium]|nr:MAG: hypothetical protein A2X47_02645 [Lentisphaerae bacterium GWF2_38_69]HBM17007.1 hypothetical protein [Lentisphaeria bacterium]
MKKRLLITGILTMLTISSYAELVTSSVYTGTITELPNPGTVIKKGSILVKFDDTPINAQIEALKADIEATKLLIANKKDDCDRVTKLIDKSAVSKNDYQDACYDYETAKVTLKMKEAELAKLESDKTCFTIVAPYDCKICKVFIMQNSGTDIGQEILEVERLN